MARLDIDTFISKAQIKHGDKYDYSLVEYITTHIKVKIICPIHGEFEQSPANHFSGKGCRKCAKKYMDLEYFIEKSNIKHNNKYDYSKTVYTKGYNQVIIICPIHGEFLQTPDIHIYKSGCPKCSNNNFKLTTEQFIAESKITHGDRYDYSKVDYIGNKKDVIIGCKIHGDFKQSPIHHKKGGGCSICNRGWRNNQKLVLLDDLEYSDLLTMDGLELLIIINQGCIPKDFNILLDSDPNTIERIATLKKLKLDFNSTNNPMSMDLELKIIDDIDDEITTIEPKALRSLKIDIISDLKSLDNKLWGTMDSDAFESLIQIKIKKLWNEILNNDGEIDLILNELHNCNGGKYFNVIKTMFFDEYNNVIKYKTDSDYRLTYQPNLMQKLIVYRLLKNKSYGNWSGTGAGKTLSYIIASHEIDARLTIVVATNSTIKQTKNSILNVYPNSKIFTEYEMGYVYDRNHHNYLILNYEKFQQEYSEEMCQSLSNNNLIDFIVIDEVHNIKQRCESEELIRRETLNNLFGRIRESNPNLHTLVMSATPIVNNLYEGKSLLTLLNGLEYSELQTSKTLGNALKMFQQLLINGLRYIPKYDIEINELTGLNCNDLDIDGSHLLNELLLIQQNNVIEIEKLLLPIKLITINKYLKSGVIIYSHYITDIFEIIEKHVTSLGFTVGLYSGLEGMYYREEVLEKFKSGEIDILIASSPIATGVDGLQKICNRMISLILPWTDSLYTQLKGRIYRQGSIFGEVEFIIPQVKIILDSGDVWSWDRQRLNLIKNKRTLADAAVDGLIPSKIFPSESMMLKKSIESLDNWKKRIEFGNIITFDGEVVISNFYPEIIDSEQRLARLNSELSEFNRRGKTTLSSTMHREFNDNPDSWLRYHTLRNERVKDWDEIPYEYIAKKIDNIDDIVIDFGCGDNKFKNCISNKVISIDHIAIDSSVIACDMMDISKYVSDSSVDVAVFSLSLWGVNYIDYISEAYRVLNRKGVIYIAESMKNYETEDERNNLIKLVKSFGFQIINNLECRGKFIYLSAIKMNK